MAIGEILPAVLVITAIYFAIKWFMSPSHAINPDGTISGVTPAMVETIHSAFPDVPVKSIIWNLTKTRSAQATSEEILERGFLPSAPNDFVPPASLLPPDSQPAPSSETTNPKSTPSKSGKSLIDRYGLSSRVPSPNSSSNTGTAKGKDIDTSTASSGSGTGTGTGPAGEEGLVGEKGKWEASKEAREKGLRERKERMILEARRRMMEKQQAST